MKTATGTEQLLSETKTVYGRSKQIGIYAIASVMNSLAAAGGECMGIEAQIMMPVGAEKSRIRVMEKIMRETCAGQGVEFAGAAGGWSPAGSLPAVTVTGLARAPQEEPGCLKTGLAGQDIVLTRWIGMDGMLRIADEKEQELEERFAPAFMRQIFSYREKIFALKELDVAKSMGVSAVRQVAEGGILAALWNLAKEAGTGLEADMRRLPVLQETIEVCEYYRLNPYQLTSVGSFLMVACDGEALADALKREQVPASVIGRMTDNNDKMLHNGEEVRYIDRPAPDEILKIYGGIQDGRDRTADEKSS